MSGAGPGQPLTVLALLTDGQDFSRAIAPQLLSVEVGGLGRLPEVTRKAAIQEVAAAGAKLLDISLMGVLIEGWREHHDLISAARRTLAKAGSTELVQLAAHQVTMTEHPSVTVLVDGDQVVTVRFGLSVLFDVTGLLARISAGQMVAVHAGRCDISATLSIDGTDAITRQRRVELPTAVPLRWGIRLLSAAEYPPGGEPASGGERSAPRDGHSWQVAPAAAETVQLPVVRPGPDDGAAQLAPRNEPTGDWADSAPGG
jgi:hypothetical protein